MTAGGDVLALGAEHQGARSRELTRDLPVGVDMHLVADQPHVVNEAVGEFTKALMEAIAIVLRRELPGARLAARHRRGDRHPAGAGRDVRAS